MEKSLSKQFRFIMIIVGIVLFVILLYVSIIYSGRKEVTVLVSPTDAAVTLNGTTVSSENLPRTTQLKPGEYTYTAERSGFETITGTYTVVEDDINTVLITLSPQTDSARQLLTSETETGALEEITGLRQAQVTLSDNFAAIEDLIPYTDRRFRIDAGLSKNDDNDDLAIYITGESPEYYENALRWLVENDVDTPQYEYIFRTYEEAGL